MPRRRPTTARLVPIPPGNPSQAEYRELIECTEEKEEYTARINSTPPTPRMEANALVAFCLRNQGPLENWHSEGRPIGDPEMKELMIKTCRNVEAWLAIRDALLRENPERWWGWVNCYHRLYCMRWEV